MMDDFLLHSRYDSAVKSHSENDSDAGSDENAKGEPRRKEAKKSAKPTKRKKEVRLIHLS